MMTVAARLLVYQPSKMSTASVLVRFIMEFTKMYFYTFSQEKCPLGCPCDNYDCELPEKKAILTLYSRGALKPLLIQPNGQFYLSVLINNKISGGTTENFEFQINDDTQVLRSCSAMLNGEVFVFGGDYTGPMNQVNLKLTSQD